MEFRITQPIASDEGTAVGAAVTHPLSIVMTAECDLEWDYRSRILDRGEKKLHHVLLLDVFEESDIRHVVGSSELWRHAKNNNTARFHHLAAGAVVGGAQLPDYYIDFKRFFTMPTAPIYTGINTGVIARVCRVPDIFIHDLMQRCFSFLARVGLPEEE